MLSTQIRLLALPRACLERLPLWPQTDNINSTLINGNVQTISMCKELIILHEVYWALVSMTYTLCLQKSVALCSLPPWCLHCCKGADRFCELCFLVCFCCLQCVNLEPLIHYLKLQVCILLCCICTMFCAILRFTRLHRGIAWQLWGWPPFFNFEIV